MITPERIKELIGHARPTILDIGCNDGTHTKIFREIFPLGTVYSFDPEPRAHERFYKMVPDGKLFKTAVGAIDGEIDFYPSEGLPSPLPLDEAREVAARLPKGWDYSGSIREPKLHKTWHPWCKFGAPVKVPIIRLDTWVHQHYTAMPIDFIWADVQGAEIDLIMGGQLTLRNTRYFYTEYSDKELYSGQIPLVKILELLPMFEVAAVYPEDVLLRNCGLQDWEL
jgi:FkbM family methyltransferase